uniref:RING-type E3 ubiquitin transferase n=1 Tax=Nothobranchius pienaari TaxID=704102 RepID=A0A1A8QKI7_9TELE
MSSATAKDSEKTCVLCCQDIDIFALGKCDHPVCYRCSTKMRVLCDQKYCAVCREELDKVVFVKKLEAFQSLHYQRFPCERKHDIYFVDETIHSQYRRLLLSECPFCREPKVFSRFEELEQHMRKQHELFCCKLCLKHLKIFSFERKWYNRKELARHRAHGDPDDTSHRGHPLCKFCDDRYLDNDELLKHLRRDHYFCHFCDADGSQEYYSDYRYLSEHFRESHYLCEEGRCSSEQFTHAFRTEIDYKAHKAAAHSKSRAEARQNRQIDLQFNYAPRQQRRNDGWSRVKSAPVASKSALKEDEFPSLSSAAVSAPMTPAYTGQPKKTSSFQEEDFPALISKVRPFKPASGTNSAWSNHTTTAKPNAHPPPTSRAPPPLSSASSGPQLLSSSNSSSSRKKKKVGVNGKTAYPSASLSDDESGGTTRQEFRSVPTMLEISSLLTVKGGSSKPPNATSASPNPPPALDSPTSKANKKKRLKNTAAPSSSASTMSAVTPAVNTIAVETAAQKENVPERTWSKPLSNVVPAPLSNGIGSIKADTPPPVCRDSPAVTPPPRAEPAPEAEEEFPALMTKKPPPGFKTSFPVKTPSAPTLPAMPPPPPGLGMPSPKPPPGFTGIPLNSNVVEPVASVPPKVLSSGYLVPEDFQHRNLELIQSIKKYLDNDESKFNQFKNYSAQFRQSLMSAAQYHRNCKDLLGDDFNRIFNELLVLLPDTGKQQELLTAHGDFKALEKQSGAGGGKKTKNKKNAWQTPASATNTAAELDCQVCPTCRQVLAPKDFSSHKTLHIRENEDFPSLQSISSIIS